MNLSNCPQLVIYLILTSLSIISSYLVTNQYIKVNDIQTHVMGNLIGHMIGMIVMSVLLYWLCKHNHHTIAWLILLLPIIFVFMILMLLITSITTRGRRKHHKHHPPHGHWR
jgi:Kef-type K+ transport system membrane component KefB